jgi:thiamine-phosphate pyrophosphorylase
VLKLPRLYPIVDVESLHRHDVPLEDYVRALLAAGIEILQLRDKLGAPQEILENAGVLSPLLAGTQCLPVMNDRADLAVLAGWRAVHVGHRDLPPEAVRQVFGPAREGSVVVGVSTHSPEQVSAADTGSADYIAVGPVFATATKTDAEPVIGLEGVRRARELTQKPIVAIGGITQANACAVLEAGADSVAVIGALLARPAAVEKGTRDFLAMLR